MLCLSALHLSVLNAAELASMRPLPEVFWSEVTDDGLHTPICQDPAVSYVTSLQTGELNETMAMAAWADGMGVCSCSNAQCLRLSRIA